MWGPACHACGGVTQRLHSQRIHKFQDLLNIVLAMICMWVCVIGGGVGREGARSLCSHDIPIFIFRH